MTNKPKLNEPDVETTFTATGESLTINMTIPTKQFKDIFVTGTSVVDQQHNLTLDECIEIWEGKEYKVKNYKKQLIIESKKYDLTINICKANLIYEISDYYESNPAFMTPELHQLLTQTLKALDGIKND